MNIDAKTQLTIDFSANTSALITTKDHPNIKQLCFRGGGRFGNRGSDRGGGSGFPSQ